MSEQDREVVGVRRGMFGINGTGDTSGYGRLVREVALPGSTPRPYGGYFDELVDRLAEVLGVVAVRPGGAVAPADAARLASRLRDREATLLVVGIQRGRPG